MDSIVLEINLISAQGLRMPSAHRRLQAYAVVWVDPAFKLRTFVDRVGGKNPTWNEKFVFRVPACFLADDSLSAVSVKIYAYGGLYLPDCVVGTVRLLIGNLRLLPPRRDCPAFEALGIRRPSGRLHGILNVGAAIIKCVSYLAWALGRCPAIGYRDLIEQGVSKKRGRRSVGARAEDPALEQWKKVAITVVGDSEEEEEEQAEGRLGRAVWLCGLSVARRIQSVVPES